jgi:hypothetical protein
VPLLADLRERLGTPTRQPPPPPPPEEGPDQQRDAVAPGPAVGIVPFEGGAWPAPPAAVSHPSAWPPPGSMPPASPPQQLVGGRLSWDTMYMFGAGLPVILPPDESADEWRRMDLDASRIKFLPASRLLHILADASPDVSRALWDFLRLTNPGWTVTAYVPGTHEPMPQGQAIVDDFLRRLTKLYGSVDVPVGRLHFGAFLRGALFSELVLDNDGRTPVDLATPDPVTARFRQVIDPVRGRVWALGQLQAGQWVDLSTRETIQYIPIDPAPASPYGRPPAAPAIFSSLFLLGLLQDLRRVVAQQGYPRYDLVIVGDALKKLTPPNVLNNPVEWKNWVETTIREVQDQYNRLEPDSAYIHTDAIQVNKPTGAISAEVMRGIDPLITAIERQLARALKTMPLMMGNIEGQSEANANRQWELQAAGIRQIQHLCEADLSEKCTLLCEAKGVAAEVEWRFAENRRAEAYRDAMTAGLEIDNATKLRLLGIISQDVLAQMTTGEEPYQDEPLFVPKGEIPFNAATGTGSPTATGEPATGQGKKPDEGKGGSQPASDKSDIERDPNARRPLLPFRLRWPDLPLRARFTRRGVRAEAAWRPGGQPLAYVPAVVPYDDGDRRRLTRAWDRAVPEAAGLLEARAPAPPDEDEAELRVLLGAGAQRNGIPPTTTE